jgi:hypothetical protein
MIKKLILLGFALLFFVPQAASAADYWPSSAIDNNATGTKDWVNIPILAVPDFGGTATCAIHYPEPYGQLAQCKYAYTYNYGIVVPPGEQISNAYFTLQLLVQQSLGSAFCDDIKIFVEGSPVGNNHCPSSLGQQYIQIPISSEYWPLILDPDFGLGVSVSVVGADESFLKVEHSGASLTVETEPIPAPVITTTVLPGGIVGNAYSQAVEYTGGASPLTWSITSGSLPAGLSLNSSTGVISGTPTTVGTSTFTVKVVDANSASSSQSFSVTTNTLLTITTSSLTAGKVGAAYTRTIQGL